MKTLTTRAFLATAGLTAACLTLGPAAQAASVPAKPTGLSARTYYQAETGLGLYVGLWVDVNWKASPGAVSYQMTGSGSCTWYGTRVTTGTRLQIIPLLGDGFNTGICTVKVVAVNDAGTSPAATAYAVV